MAWGDLLREIGTGLMKAKARPEDEDEEQTGVGPDTRPTSDMLGGPAGSGGIVGVEEANPNAMVRDDSAPIRDLFDGVKLEPEPVPDQLSGQHTSGVELNPFKERRDAAVSNLDRLKEIDVFDPEDKEALREKYDKKKDNIWKNLGKGIMFGMSQISPILLNPNIDDETAWGAAVGGALGGAIANVADPLLDEKMQHQGAISRAMQNVQQAQGAYDQDIQNRTGEMQIANIEDQIGTRALETQRKMDELGVKARNAETGRMRAETARAKTVVEAIKGGSIGRQGADQLGAALSDLLGVPVTVPEVDGVVEDVRLVGDAETGVQIHVVTFKDGRQQTQVLRNPDGSPIVAKSDRVKVAEIQGSVSLSNTQTRVGSAERIAKWNNATRQSIAEMGVEAQEAADIFKAVDEEMGSILFDEDEAIRQLSGQDPASISPEERERLLSLLYQTKVRRRLEARKAAKK